MCAVCLRKGRSVINQAFMLFMCAKVARCSWELKGHISFSCVVLSIVARIVLVWSMLLRAKNFSIAAGMAEMSMTGIEPGT